VSQETISVSAGMGASADASLIVNGKREREVASEQSEGGDDRNANAGGLFP
jgi:hypothetical protein